MSRGHGKIERFLVHTVAKRPEDTVWPLLVITEFYAAATGTRYTAHLRASFRRAANDLAESGTLTRWLSPGPARLCVSRPNRGRVYVTFWPICAQKVGLTCSEEGVNLPQLPAPDAYSPGQPTTPQRLMRTRSGYRPWSVQTVDELAVPIYHGGEVTGAAQADSGVDVELSDGQSLRAARRVRRRTSGVSV